MAWRPGSLLREILAARQGVASGIRTEMRTATAGITTNYKGGRATQGAGMSSADAIGPYFEPSQPRIETSILQSPEALLMVAQAGKQRGSIRTYGTDAPVIVSSEIRTYR